MAIEIKVFFRPHLLVMNPNKKLPNNAPKNKIYLNVFLNELKSRSVFFQNHRSYQVERMKRPLKLLPSLFYQSAMVNHLTSNGLRWGLPNQPLYRIQSEAYSLSVCVFYRNKQQMLRNIKKNKNKNEKINTKWSCGLFKRDLITKQSN